MKLVTRLLIALAFLYLRQPIVGKTAPATSIALLASQNHAPGSVVRFEHVTVQDGLSQSAGQAIFQDSRGFLWVGTQDGLNRYDGYTFTVFKHKVDDPSSISNNNILSIEEDENGNLWIGTLDGLNRFNPVTETFIHYKNIPDNAASLSHNLIT